MRIDITDIKFSLTRDKLIFTITVPKGVEVSDLWIDTEYTIRHDLCINEEYTPNLKSLWDEEVSLYEKEEFKDWRIDKETLSKRYDVRTVEIPIKGTTAELLKTDYIWFENFIVINVKTTGLATDTSFWNNDRLSCTDEQLHIPLYNLLPLRMAFLSAYNSEISACDCQLPREAICDMLAIFAIEEYMEVGHIYEAAEMYRLSMESLVRKYVPRKIHKRATINDEYDSHKHFGHRHHDGRFTSDHHFVHHCPVCGVNRGRH